MCTRVSYSEELTAVCHHPLQNFTLLYRRRTALKNTEIRNPNLHWPNNQHSLEGRGKDRKMYKRTLYQQQSLLRVLESFVFPNYINYSEVPYMFTSCTSLHKFTKSRDPHPPFT